jgi:nicotinate-nucleotide adenylyltransferase
MGSERIGILGGTFDPPHIGHLILAECAADTLHLDKLLLAPAADPPHKLAEHKAEVLHRLAMLALAVSDNPRLTISRVDIDRPGPHYSVDMLHIIRSAYPQVELFFLMGSDSLRDFPNWHCPEVIMRLCRLAVMQRPGAESVAVDMHDHILPGLSERIVLVDAPMIEISSSTITSRLWNKQSIRYMVPDSVLDYIEAHNLYVSQP